MGRGGRPSPDVPGPMQMRNRASLWQRVCAPALLEPRELAVGGPGSGVVPSSLPTGAREKNQPCEIKPVSEKFLDGIHKARGEKVEHVKSSSSQKSILRMSDKLL